MAARLSIPWLWVMAWRGKGMLLTAKGPQWLPVTTAHSATAASACKPDETAKRAVQGTVRESKWKSRKGLRQRLWQGGRRKRAARKMTACVIFVYLFIDRLRPV
eukprot:6175944-Pyramimonas_sp.AAC.1